MRVVSLILVRSFQLCKHYLRYGTFFVWHSVVESVCRFQSGAFSVIVLLFNYPFFPYATGEGTSLQPPGARAINGGNFVNEDGKVIGRVVQGVLA